MSGRICGRREDGIGGAPVRRRHAYLAAAHLAHGDFEPSQRSATASLFAYCALPLAVTAWSLASR
jgi:hypothetical protein